MGDTPSGEQNGTFITGITRSKRDDQWAGSSSAVVPLRLNRLCETLAVDHILFRRIPICTEHDPYWVSPASSYSPPWARI